MNIAIIGAGPFPSTGYGVQIRGIIKCLQREHQVISISHESDIMTWGGWKKYHYPDGSMVDVYPMPNPQTDPQQAADIVKYYCREYNIDLMLALWDAFALKWLEDVGKPYVTYIPVDSEFTWTWYNHVRMANRIVAMSIFGYNQILRFAHPSQVEYIPHSVDTSIYRPLDRSSARRYIMDHNLVTPPIPDTCFLYSTVGANLGSRKNLPLLLRTFKNLLDDERVENDLHLYIHTNPNISMGSGYNLVDLTSQLGIEGNVHYPSVSPIYRQFTDEDMCNLYCSSNVYVSNSSAEGFGVPILEAMSCGIPVIVPANSSQTELGAIGGWAYNIVDPNIYCEYPISEPYGSYYLVPDQRGLLKTMYRAQESQDITRAMGENARRMAEQYDWSVTQSRWLKLVKDIGMDAMLVGGVRM